jgi:hypothetical protein
MIETQIIHAEGKPIAVILDYREYLNLKESAGDREDYESAIKVRKNNKKWMKHEDLKKELGL